MRAFFYCLGLCVFLFCFNGIAQAASSSVLKDVRVWDHAGRAQLAFVLTRRAKYAAFTLTTPDRVVIDFQDVKRDAALNRLRFSPLIRQVRTAVKSDGRLRIVLDVASAINIQTRWSEMNPQWLLLDLVPVKKKIVTNSQTVRNVSAHAHVPWRPVRVVIDPGHGGRDPGAVVGKNYEKTITLAVAKALKKKIDRAPGMEAVLTRDRDQFIGLRKRLAKAREGKADLFISVHADSFKDTQARGSSVYILSQDGASSEAARWLAEEENRALLGGPNLEHQDDVLASVLFDLSQTASRHDSYQSARAVMRHLSQVTHSHYRHVQKADFAVLKAPDVPSMLVELGFMSNPQEAKMLGDWRYQRTLVSAIFSGVQAYFKAHPPSGSFFAQKRVHHRVVSGDTLAILSARYGVSMKKIKSANQLHGNTIYLGQSLSIPLQR